MLAYNNHMFSRKFKFCFTTVLIVYFSTHANAEISSIPENAPIQKLSLKDAVLRAMESNKDLKENKLSLQSSEISYNDAWDQMYIPQINLALNTSASKTIAPISKGVDYNPAYENHGYPSSFAGVSLGEYTLFNFGKDKITFDQAKLEWERNKEIFEEQKRSVRFSVINAFWSLKSKLNKLDGYEHSVEIASVIVKLLESRVMMNKATWTDVSSSNVDLMNVKNFRDKAKTEAMGALYSLNVLLGDEVGTRYQIDEEIIFLPIKVTEEVLYETYLKESPNIKNARKDLLKAHMSLELSEKNQLPLPSVKFSGVTVGYGNNLYGGKLDPYTQYGSKNFEVSAGVNFTMPLTGPGGLFGNRKVEYYKIQRETNEIHIANIANKDRQQIFDYIQNIRQYEQTIENNRQSYKDSMVVLQSIFDGMLKQQVFSRLDVRDAINQARDREQELNDALITHLYNKTQLAAFIGVDYLPRME